MAKGNARKGMTMIGPTPGHRVKQLEVRSCKANGQNRSRLVEVAIKEPVVTTPGHTGSFPSSLPSKYSRLPSKHQFQTEDGVENVYDMNEATGDPMPIPRKKVQTQNDYIREWLPQKQDFLHILLELEAPPVPWICKKCQRDGVIQQWTGAFFEDSALHMTGLQLHLGHGRAPCSSASTNEPAPLSGQSRHATAGKERDHATDNSQDLSVTDDGEWEDVDNIPCHLWPPVGSKYLTIVDVTGMHFLLVQACQCPNADSFHMQLFWAKLCPSTFEKPSTAFTFSVLDDFLRDNVECGTSGMNYYNKLRRVTSNVFPHLVVVAQQWRLLKLLKWSSFKDNKNCSNKGDLAIFCTACPQPGINVSTTGNLDHSWKYTRTVVMDGNFKAEQMHERQPDDQVWLMDGCGFMKSACNNHKAISQASASCSKLNSTGLLTFKRVKGWVDGEIIETLWSTLNIVSASTRGMTSPHCQKLLDFQMNDSNFMKMIRMADSLSWKLKTTQASVVLAREAFERFKKSITPIQQMSWSKQEEATLLHHIHDPSVMDVFEIQLKKEQLNCKAQTRICHQHPPDTSHTCATSSSTPLIAVVDISICMPVAVFGGFRRHASTTVDDGELTYLEAYATYGLRTFTST
ncbi:hypothetical protein BKA83DRAFT_4129225 [Pisolithus microcarpus]|nr:hypothetical protein BKA83DRAFT_4129225 [Pisolithus microcarpus]